MSCINKTMEPVSKEHSNFVEMYESSQLSTIYSIVQRHHKKNFWLIPSDQLKVRKLTQDVNTSTHL